MFWLRRKKSGTKQYAVLESDDRRELERLARRLRVPVHGKGGQAKHLDLSGHRIEVAKRLGAREKEEGPAEVMTAG